jgi:fatty acid desaturase
MSIAEPRTDKATLPGVHDDLFEVSVDGTTWREFRKSLAPNYFLVWRDITLIHAAIWLGLAGAFLTDAMLPIVWAAVCVPCWAMWIGFWLLALLSFGHESAHDNLASNRHKSDRLANWFIWPLFGQSAAQYRRVHWQHHLHLGDPQDTEVSYHHCLSPWFLLKTLTGLHLIAAFARHLGAIRRSPTDAEQAAVPLQRSLSDRWPIVRSMFIHASLAGGAVWFGYWWTALTWWAAVVIVLPFLATIRQAIEHRRLDADCRHDFTREVHGPVNHLLGTGVFARLFGAAGFNRHLLHHWDPRISYTRFDEMEAFLLRTSVRQELDSCRTTYWAVFRELLRSARHG